MRIFFQQVSSFGFGRKRIQIVFLFFCVVSLIMICTAADKPLGVLLRGRRASLLDKAVYVFETLRTSGDPAA